MKYELKDWKLNGVLRDNGDGTSSQPIIIIPQIVGDEYGFLAPDPSRNMTIAILSNKGLDIDQLRAECQKQAVVFCDKQYPSK